MLSSFKFSLFIALSACRALSWALSSLATAGLRRRPFNIPGPRRPSAASRQLLLPSTARSSALPKQQHLLPSPGSARVLCKSCRDRSAAPLPPLHRTCLGHDRRTSLVPPTSPAVAATASRPRSVAGHLCKTCRGRCTAPTTALRRSSLGHLRATALVPSSTSTAATAPRSHRALWFFSGEPLQLQSAPHLLRCSRSSLHL